MKPKYPRSSLWKYFWFYTVDGKVTKKDKAVCQLCKRQLSYSSTKSAGSPPNWASCQRTSLFEEVLNLSDLDFWKKYQPSGSSCCRDLTSYLANNSSSSHIGKRKWMNEWMNGWMLQLPLRPQTPLYVVAYSIVNLRLDVNHCWPTFDCDLLEWSYFTLKLWNHVWQNRKIQDYKRENSILRKYKPCSTYPVSMTVS